MQIYNGHKSDAKDVLIKLDQQITDIHSKWFIDESEKDTLWKAKECLDGIYERCKF